MKAEMRSSRSKMKYDKKTGTMITEEDRKMNNVMRQVNKREISEYKKHEEARLVGEISEDEDIKMKEASSYFLAFDDKTLSDEDDDNESVGNFVQRHVVDVFTGDAIDDMGTITPRTTRASEKEWYVGDCNRSSIQSVNNQLNVNGLNMNASIAEHTSLIASIEVLKELKR